MNYYDEFIESTIKVFDIMFKHGFFILREWEGKNMEEYALEFEKYKIHFRNEAIHRYNENLSKSWRIYPKCMYNRKNGALAEECGLQVYIDYNDVRDYGGRYSGDYGLYFKFYHNYLFTPLIIDPYSTRIEWNIEGYNLNKGRIPKLVHEIYACHDWREGYNENVWEHGDNGLFYNGNDIFISLGRIKEEFEENPPEVYFDVDAYIEKYKQK